MEVAYQVRAAHAHRRGARRRRWLRAAMGGMVVLVAVAVASHLTRDDTLTVGQVLRLAGQFRAFRPGALVGLTIPTVPALRRNNVVLRPRPGIPDGAELVGVQQPWRTRQLQCAGKGLGAARPGPG
jgi:hypothetical protein